MNMKKKSKVILSLLLIICGLFVIYHTQSKKTEEVQAAVTTGTWGTVSWSFDSTTGVLTFTSGGTLGPDKNADGSEISGLKMAWQSSPWNRVIDAGWGGNKEDRVPPEAIKKIVFTKPVTAPANSQFLFSGVYYGTDLGPEVGEPYENGSSLPQLTSIEGLDKLDTSKVTTMRGMFHNASSLVLSESDLLKFNTSQVQTMFGMFMGCTSLQTLNLSKFDVSNVTTMEQMFLSCSKLTKMDLSSFTNPKVTAMRYMFKDCASLQSPLDLTNFKTPSVTDMFGMFSGCKALTTLDLTSFVTNNVIHMAEMFQACENLISVDITTFNATNVQSFDQIFNRCYKLSSIDLSKFYTPNARTYLLMFGQCRALKKIDVSTFVTETDRVQNYGGMFWGCEVLEEIKGLDKFKTGLGWYFNWMFADCKKLKSVDLSSFDTKSAWGMQQMFLNCETLTEITFPPTFTTSTVYAMYQMFDGCKNIKELDLSTFSYESMPINPGADPVANTVKDMLANMTSLEKLTLNAQFPYQQGAMYGGKQPINLPMIQDMTNYDATKHTGRWIKVDANGNPVVAVPNETVYNDSKTFANNYTTACAGTYIWEPKSTVHLPAVMEHFVLGVDNGDGTGEVERYTAEDEEVKKGEKNVGDLKEIRAANLRTANGFGVEYTIGSIYWIMAILSDQPDGKLPGASLQQFQLYQTDNYKKYKAVGTLWGDTQGSLNKHIYPKPGGSDYAEGLTGYYTNKFTAETIYHVYYLYKEKPQVKVTMHYVDENGNPLTGIDGSAKANEVVETNQGEDWSSPKDILTGNPNLNTKYTAVGYRVGKDPAIITTTTVGNEITGKLTAAQTANAIDIYYVYKTKENTVTEYYINDAGEFLDIDGKIVASETAVGTAQVKFGDTYTATKAVPPTGYTKRGYRLNSKTGTLVSNTGIDGTIANVTENRKIYYVFERKKYQVTEKYVDEDGKALDPAVTDTSKEVAHGGSYSNTVSTPSNYQAIGYKENDKPTGATDKGIKTNTIDPDGNITGSLSTPIEGEGRTIYYIYRRYYQVTVKHYFSDKTTTVVPGTAAITSYDAAILKGATYAKTITSHATDKYKIVGYSTDGGTNVLGAQTAGDSINISLPNIQKDTEIIVYYQILVKQEFYQRDKDGTLTDISGKVVSKKANPTLDYGKNYAEAYEATGYKAYGYEWFDVNGTSQGVKKIYVDGKKPEDTPDKVTVPSQAIKDAWTIKYYYKKVQTVTEKFVDVAGNALNPEVKDKKVTVFYEDKYENKVDTPSGYEAFGYKETDPPTGATDLGIKTDTISNGSITGSLTDEIKDDARVIYYIYRQRNYTFYARQYIREVNGGIPVTPKGYISLKNQDKVGTGAVTVATYQTQINSVTDKNETDTVADYTPIEFRIKDLDKTAIQLIPIVPEHYKVVGYLVTTDPAQNLSTNPTQTLATTYPEFMLSGKTYVTVVLEPIKGKDGTPPMFDWDYKTNSFGVLKKN